MIRNNLFCNLFHAYIQAVDDNKPTMKVVSIPMGSYLPPCCSCEKSINLKPIGDRIIKTQIVSPTASSVSAN